MLNLVILLNTELVQTFILGSVYFAAKMPVATGLAETKYTQKINPKANPSPNFNP